MARSLAQSARRRPGGRDLKPLSGLWPYVRRRLGDVMAAGLFLTVSSSASLGLSAAGRLVVDHGLQLHDAAALNRTFACLLYTSPSPRD